MPQTTCVLAFLMIVRDPEQESYDDVNANQRAENGLPERFVLDITCDPVSAGQYDHSGRGYGICRIH